ncbi:efflux RND transporter permease subunit [Aneurinibacillus aneurinilyticus]|uniref:efflux RND transporter permease subunit n=1 Tax=Aneurinibacillus aneurinilyticus TaxID=1391 RepID=UPI002E1FAC5F|nr:efflux RND transporter permease subunit [Aneurinibacillus aneurinilyticus]
MERFIEFCLQHKLIVYLLTFFILFAGTASIFTFKRELMPKRNYPWITVNVSGASIPAEEMEDKVTNPVEKEINSLSNIKNYQSTTTPGNAQVRVEAEDGKGEQVKQDIESAVNRLRNTFPKTVKTVTVVQEGNQATEVLMSLALSGKELPVLYNLSKTDFTSRLEAIEGVKKVEVSNANVANKIQITFKPDQLAAYKMTPKGIVDQLQESNVKQAIGTLKNRSFNTVVEIDNSYKTVEQINSVFIKTPIGNVPLSNLAVTEDMRGKKKDAIFRYNGEDYVQLSLTKTESSDIIRTSDKVKEEIEKINKESNGKYKMTVSVDFASYIKPSINNLSRDLTLGGLLAIIILLIFLRNWRVTLVISTTLPVSIMMTFIGMKFGGYNIDMVTLISLSLSTGLIVDAAIVVLESIYHLREKGHTLRDAIKQGVKEVITPVLTSQLTIIVVFVPLVLSNLGGTGFKPIMMTIAFTITVAILASTIAALLFVPVFSNSFLQKDKQMHQEAGGRASGLTNFFVNFAALALRHRIITIILAGCLFAGALMISPMVQMSSINDIDENHVYASVKLQSGEALESALSKTLQIERDFKKIPEIKDLYITTDKQSLGIDMNLIKIKERKRPKEEILLDMNNKLNALKGVEHIQVGFGSSGQMAPGVELEVKGKDNEVLHQLSEKTEKMLATIPGIKNARSDFSAGEEKVILTPRQDIMNQLGITQQSLMAQIEGFVNEESITNFTLESLELDVVARYPENLMKHPEQLRQINITTPEGVKVPLTHLIDWKYSKSLKSIAHKDGERVANIHAEIIGSDPGTVGREVTKKLEGISVPTGYSIEMAGTLKQQGENAQSALMALLTVIGMIYLIMVAQFNRLSHPFIIMLSLPMAIVGVVVGLVVTQRPLNELGYVGIIMLVGIVVSNAILLIDRINLLRNHDKMELKPAILEAVRNRVRPILMTKLTAILGMLPLALAMSEGGALEAPIATIVISGLIFHTIITLVLVPVLYSIFEDMDIWRKNRQKRKKQGRNIIHEKDAV